MENFLNNEYERRILIVDGLCYSCGHRWDAHWHHFDLFYVAGRTCPRCGSSKIIISTDEDDDLKEQAYYETRRRE